MNTFRLGGVHPQENKLASENAIESFPLPEKAVVFVS